MARDPRSPAIIIIVFPGYFQTVTDTFKKLAGIDVESS
jgi:hypothetical protein